jgi:HYR domain/Secretion system C-terminal sorting domain
MRKIYKLILGVVLLFIAHNYTQAQTTLATGDIAFTGYISNTGVPTTQDRFSFVLLAPVTNGTVIKFTDRGWLNTNAFRGFESFFTWTVSGALPAGTEVTINGLTTSTGQATITGGATNGTVTITHAGTTTSFNLSSAGDQLFCYQGTEAAPTFICGIHYTIYTIANGNPVNTSAAALEGNALDGFSSALPPGLVAGTNLLIVGTIGTANSQSSDGKFNCTGPLNTAAQIRTAVYNLSNWTLNPLIPSALPSFTLPTACPYLGLGAVPSITVSPAPVAVCEGANASFSITATGAIDYQWQVDQGSGFTNLTNAPPYSGVTTPTLTITSTPIALNSFQYRCIASNGTGPATSTAAQLTVGALPIAPTLLVRTPLTGTVADGTPVSATFNAGSGGTGCADEFRFTTNGGASYSAYTPGATISTTGLSLTGGMVSIEGRRANCSAGCSGSYVTLASWIVTPLPLSASTLNAGDIGFTGYISSGGNEFSFVLLRNIGSGTTINFTDNGWLSTNVFRTGEQTVTWTSNAAYSAGTEIRINGLTATLASGGSAGTVTGTALSLSSSGDQVLAYRGSAAAPTFISAIHMNVFSISAGNPTTTSAAAWDGSANSTNASALPLGLTTGVNAIWIGTQNVPSSRFSNSRYGNCGGPGTLGPVTTLRATLNNQANWISNNNNPAGFVLPTGCSYLGVGTPPNITTPPAASSVCEATNASFSVVATGASTFQWQVNTGMGFNDLTNTPPYSGVNTATLTITSAPAAFNGHEYRCIVGNGAGSVPSNGAILTVTLLPVSPSLLVKTPATNTVADGTTVSATFNPGSGGTGCTDDFRYTTDGGLTYLPYTPGNTISTSGLAASGGYVLIEGRRANCSAGCQGTYTVLATWLVTPLPTTPTTLNAGDIAFSGYSSFGSNDFSFVLLRNIGPGTAINFTDNGWLSTNVFRTGEQTVTWTAPAGGLAAGTEIVITGLTATKSGGGNAGTVTGTAISLSSSGDQVLAYRGSAAAPTFISGIHMNVLSTTIGQPVSTTAAAWDGTDNSPNSSALPTGLTTGVNAIWIGTQNVPASRFSNSKYGNCSGPATLGPVNTLRAALNNQANWISNNNPSGIVLPTGCNYLSTQSPAINVTGTPLSTFSACAGTTSAEQSFVVSGTALTANINITAPTGFEISTTSGSGFAGSLILTQSGGSVANTTIFVRLSASATGTPSGNITVASVGVATVNVAVSGTVNPIPPTPTITAGGPTTFCPGGSVVLTSSSATGNLWSTGETTQSITVTTGGTYSVTVTSAGCTSAPSAGITVTVNPTPATPTITAGGPTTFCTGGSVTLTSSSATGNLWSTGETTQSITVTTGGTYTVTVTENGCTSAASAGTTVTADALPTTADAGPDINACINPGTANMAANPPTVGTGAWTQISGPVTTSFGANNPITIVVGLNTAGTYTYVWTISNGTCAPSTDTMSITVNPNPAPFTLTGGGTFCPGTTTLTGPSVPNSTYTWQRSLTGIANPNSFGTFGGTASTQDVTSSGNYRLIITNQFGCSTSDTTPVSKADFVFDGSLATGDAQQTGRLNRFATLSTCAAPKGCPLTFTTTGARFFDSYNITNPSNVPVCATIGLRSDCGTSIFNVAYLGSFDPTAPCTNYLADPGSSFPGTGYMEVTIPANATIVLVVHEVNPGTGCAGYQLTVDVPRETGVTVNPATPICSATPVTLTAPLASSYLWNPGGNATQAITVSPAVTTEYFVTLGYGNVGCTTLDSAEVVVNQLPTVAFAGNDTAVCGLTINNLAANTPAVGTGTWTLVTGPGTVNFSNANAPNSSATASVNGVYTLRWTIATGAPCPNSSQDDVIVNFAATPSTADAGVDKTACVSPARATMTAAVPTAGSGVWTQVAGPVTANIISPAAPNTIITGLNTTGTYTFRWTVSNNPCPSNFDEVDVVVNNNPASFSITGGGTFCPTGTTLSGPVDPNYTYQWGKSYLTTPFANLGTGQTENVTSSGIYQLVVTNQFGCPTSATAVVNAADYVFNGSLDAGDAVQTGRLNRFAAISTCAAPKACPNTFTTTGSRAYDSYTITNPRPVPVCAVIGVNSGCGTAIFSVAYSGSFDPNNLCNNYLADPGSSPSTSIFYEATIPANGTIVVVVHEVNPGQGCANYSLTVDVPRDGAPIVVNPPSVTCASTATLTAPVASSYLWTPGGATTRSITTPPLFVDTKYNVTLGYGNNGCTRLDSATVTVTSLPPTISCPANISANNTPGICGRAVTYTPTVGGLPAPTISYAFTGATIASGSGDGSGSVFNVGVTTVTLTATNACGSVDCSFTVTITDNQAPTVTLGSIGSCYPTVAAAQAAALAATSATDNCPGVLTETASTVGTCSAVVTVTTTDAAGNTTSVSYNTRIDNTSPTVTLGTIASCYPTVAAAEAAALAATSATDNCPGALVETASTVGTCSAVITITTTDGCGNSTSVSYNTRIDNTSPTVTVGTIASCYPTVAAAEAAALAATSATDNCPGALVETVATAGTCSAVITITTTDGCGNSTSVSYNTRIDNVAPQLTCPAPVTVSCASLVPVPDITTVTGVTDNCPGAITVTHRGDVISNQTCANRYTVTRTYRATDGCGNFTECTQIITVNDQTAPVMTCPAPITVSCASEVPVPDISTVTGVSDNCGAVTVTFQGDVISNQTCPNRFTVTRTYRATDVCGNFTECTQIITVNDQTAPVINCPANVTVSCASQVPPPDVTNITANPIFVSDNCSGPITVTFRGDVISNQTCANRFTISRTYRATDACGNFSECVQTITVNDQTAPVMTCPAPVTVSCTSDVPAPSITAVTGVSDNCAGVVTVTHVGDVISNQTCANRFTITRTYRATDVCGNFTECTQIITVNDQTAPVMTCPAPVTVSCANSVPAPSITAVTGVSDNCAGVVTVTHIGDVISNQTCANRFTITRTYRATDVCGNFTECTQIITVNDQTAPVLTCPANITVSCAGAVPAPNVASVTGVSDNCGGSVTVTHMGDIINSQTCANRFTILRTYRATDACGNFTECTQTIIVNDQTAPVITCPADIVVNTTGTNCTAIVNYNVTATDNCGTVTITTSQASGTAFPIGVTTVTARATDACGNTSTCTFTVRVVDSNLPVITAQPVNRTVCVGENATFSVTATNATNFQWQLLRGTNWVNVPGANASSFTVVNTTLAMHNDNYRVLITGPCSVVSSNPAVLRVNPRPAIILTPSPLASIKPGQTTSIIATTTPPGGVYLWTLNGVALNVPTTTSGISPIRIENIGLYQLNYTDPNGCTNTASVQIGATPTYELFIYPNPNNGRFQVRFYNEISEQVSVVIYDPLGQKMYEQKLQTTGRYSRLDVDIRGKAQGYYLVTVVNSNNNQLAAKRVLVVR